MSRAEPGGGGSPRREQRLAAAPAALRAGPGQGDARPPSRAGSASFPDEQTLICSVFCPYWNSAALTSLCRIRIRFPPPAYVAVSRQQRQTRRRNYSSVRVFAREVAVALFSVLSEGLGLPSATRVCPCGRAWSHV